MASPRTTNAVLPDRRTDPSRSGAAVQLSNVTRVFGVTPALVRATLTVAPGETVLVRGANGAGKSTLLRVIATALAPTYGTGTVLGFDLIRDRERIRGRMELMGHRTRLYEDLTAVENLRFTCGLHGIDHSGVPEVLQRVGLDGVGGERIRGYSQGMRQRVAVARALLRRPDLLLLDEPYAGLDDAAKEVVDEAILAAQAEGRTVILATHDPTRGGMAGRTLRMDQGRLMQMVPADAGVGAAR